jgi:hypothetical protein
MLSAENTFVTFACGWSMAGSSQRLQTRNEKHLAKAEAAEAERQLRQM